MKKTLASNRKAFHNYEILDKIEAGIVLSGHEVKSAKQSNASLVDAFVRFANLEAFAENIFIAPYTQISTHVLDYESKKSRKLLMHKTEIIKLSTKVKEKGLAVVPLEIYINERCKIKVLVGLAKGRKSYDKKELLKKRDIKREMDREVWIK
ncbi:MAG: SsrA-binding protein SmpB [Elusimicrobiota bacterium]|jgi:SsrA-binding protein|nr:SsrA-binding protein SmpB [Elusimicrobiota bacterium]